MNKFYFPISVKDLSKLQPFIKTLTKYLKENKLILIQDLSYTLCVGRDHFRHRVITSANSIEELTQKLEDINQLHQFDEVEKSYFDGNDINWEDYFKSSNKVKIIEIPVYEFNLINTIKSDMDPMEELEDLGYQAILLTLQSLCKSREFLDKLMMFPRENISNCNIVPDYLSLIIAWIEELSEAGYFYNGLTAKSDEILSNKSIDIVLEDLNNFIDNNKTYAEFGSLLKIFIEKYSAILTGKEEAKELLVNNEKQFSDIYGNNVMSTLNNLMANFISNEVINNKEHTKILEAGAGTCATTIKVVSMLTQKSCHNWQYCCSDISLYLINQAREKFSDNRVNFEVIDISQENKQYFEYFNIILATNVLHAIADIRQTLRNINKLLKENGFIVLGEITTKRSFLTQTFGLFKDWWNGQNDSYRERNSPVIGSSSWKRLLEDAGFVIEKIENVEGAKWQSLIVARKISNDKIANNSHNKQDNTIEKLSNIISKVSGKKDIPVDSNFAEYGVDSLMIVALAGEINRSLKTSIRATNIFDYPTVRKLAAYIDSITSQTHLDVQTLSNWIHITKNDFSLHNHKVFGKSLLPLDEWIRLIFESLSGYDELKHFDKISDFKIIAPVFLQEESAKLKFVYERQTDSTFLCRIFCESNKCNDEKEVCFFKLTKETKNYDRSYNRGCFGVKVTEEDVFSLGESHIGKDYKCIKDVTYDDSGFSCNFDTNRITREMCPINNAVILCILYPYFILNDREYFYMPSSIANLSISKLNGIHSCDAFMVSSDNQYYKFDVFFYDINKNKIAEFYDLCISRSDINDSVESAVIASEKNIYLEKEKLELGKEFEPIAVVGFSGKFGSATDINKYYEVLLGGGSFVQKLPKSREDFWIGDTSVVGGFLNDIDKFDNEFFEFSLQEAEYTEPQQRLFLQEAWKALENAGITTKYLGLNKDKIGVFVGACSGDYSLYIDKVNNNKKPQTFWGTSASLISARVSYFFDIHGPSMTIDTACSSSLVALHQACESIRSGESSVAIVGGVFCMTTDEFFKLGKQAAMISKDDKCYTFDERANGFVPGESISAFVLKPLHLAIKDNDDISALIMATGVNQDGRTNTITAPSAKSQTALMESVYKKYKINPENIVMVEAHGTGTSLGDPIEFRAISDAFRKFTDKKRFCYIGSSKTNLGHSAGGAGLAGFAKVVMSLKNRTIAKTINFNNINPIINIEDSPFIVCEQNVSIKDYNKLATVSAFGFGGTNAHAVISGYNHKQNTQIDSVRKIYPIVISANSEYSFFKRLADLRDYIMHSDSVSLSSLAYTLSCRRSQLKYKIAIAVGDTKELVTKLSLIVDKKVVAYCNSAILEDFNNKSAFSSQNLENFGDFQTDVDLYIKSKFEFVDFNEDLFEHKFLINIPTYSFVEKSIWIENTKSLNDVLRQSIENHDVAGDKVLPFMCALFYVYGMKIDNSGLEEIIFYKSLRLNDLSDITIRKTNKKIGVFLKSTEECCFSGNKSNRYYSHADFPKLEELLENRGEIVTKTEFYDLCRRKGINYGSPFMGIEELYLKDYAFAKIHNSGSDIFIMDMVLQPIFLLHDNNNFVSIPYSISYFSGISELPEEVYSFIRKNEEAFDGIVYDKLGRVCFYFLGLKIINKPLIQNGIVTNNSNIPATKASNDTPQKLKVASFLREVIASVLRIEPEKIKLTENFSKLGMDSTLMVTIIETFELYCDYPIKGMPGTVFFEYKNLDEFSDYILSEHKDWVDAFIHTENNNFESYELYKSTNEYVAEDKKTNNIPATKAPNDTPQKLKVASFLREVIASVLRIEPEKIKLTENFSKLGMDSTLMVTIIETFELYCDYPIKGMPGTVFFEYKNLDEFSDYILSEYKDWVDAFIHTEKHNDHEIKESRDTFATDIISQDIDNVEGDNDSIAVIGIFGSYGPYSEINEFWEALVNGNDAVTSITEERGKLWGKEYKKDDFKGAWLNDIDTFDPIAYGITPIEATLMDPQERKFLDAVRRCIEEAGYSPESLTRSANEKIGVYVGAMYGHYELYGNDFSKGEKLPNSFFSTIANRVNYTFNLKGNSLAIDTMCSSSLSALHIAKIFLRNGEINAAIVGGVNITSHPRKYNWLLQNSFLSKSGQCTSYGKREDGDNGYVPGEGVGVVILKRLADAKKDKDNILGIIRGSAINHVGQSIGYTVPDVDSQVNVVKDAIRDANVSTSQISYIEGHGTGTILGDPIEVKALTNVFNGNAKIKLGSVKSNIGHLESASFIAALTKVILQMKHKKLVPTIKSQKTNKQIDFANVLSLQHSIDKWEGEKLVAGISSFGAGGSNGHVIVENYCEINSYEHIEERPFYIICFSANSIADLERHIKDVRNWIYQKTETFGFLSSLSFILTQERTNCKYRIHKIVTTLHEMKEFLESLVSSFSKKTWFQEMNANNEHVNEKILDKLSEQLENYFGNVAENYPSNEYLQKLKSALVLYSSGKKIPKTCEIYARLDIPSVPYSGEKYWIRNIEEENNNSSILLKKNLKLSPVEPISGDFNDYNFIICDDLNLLTEDIVGKTVLIFKEREITTFDTIFSFISTLQNILKKCKKYFELVIISYVDDNTSPEFLAFSNFLSGLSFEYEPLRTIEIKTDNLGEILDIKDKTREIINIIDPSLRKVEEIQGELFVRSEENINSEFKEKIKINEKDVFLITGGMGNLGTILVDYLVKNRAKNIAILGKKSLDIERKNRIDDLKKIGIKVAYDNPPLENIDELRNSISLLQKEFGKIKGVFHFAGTISDGEYAFINKTIEDFKCVYNPKAIGLKNLYDLLKNESDFFISSSSISAKNHKLSIGLSDYAFANSFLDAFSNKNPKCCSIHFPLIEGSIYGNHEDDKISKSDIKNVLNSILINNITGVIDIFFKNASSDDLFTKCSDYLSDLLRNELKLSEEVLNFNTDFKKIGINSIIIVDVLKKIETKLSINLNPNIIIANNSISKLTKYFVDNFSDKLDCYLIEKE